MDTAVSLLDLTVSRFAFPGGPQVLGDVQLSVMPGAIIGVMGPNGCGKTTLLWLLAGERNAPTVLRKTAIGEEQIALVIQDYRSSLFAWKTSLHNLALPLILRGEALGSAETKAWKLATQLDLPADLSRYPAELSGGEQQKLCVVRALLEEPRLLLLDESFSAMDYRSRLLFLTLLRERLRGSGTAAVLVSHSAEEAFMFCDELLLMRAPGLVLDRITDCQSREHYVDNLERVHAHFRH